MVNENGSLVVLKDQSITFVHQTTKCNQPTIVFFQIKYPDLQKISFKTTEKSSTKTDSPIHKTSPPPKPQIFLEKFLSGNELVCKGALKIDI